jgi:hypothetical protein
MSHLVGIEGFINIGQGSMVTYIEIKKHNLVKDRCETS